MVAQGMSAFLIILVGSLLNLLPGVAQTTGTATVLGTVRDPTEAVIPGATVELTDLATNQTRSQTTNMNGQYIFVNVLPGVYKITASASGFRQAVIPSLKIEVAKAYTVDFTLEVGTVAEMVEVTPGAGVELQTVNATVGNVIRSDYLLRLPLIDRQANSLFQLQPMVSPLGYGFNASGAVAGARGDQATWMVDGIDVTQGKFPDTGDATSFPLPAESIEEFRAGVTNVDAFFGRSAGGQFVAVRKRGGNTVHGSVYWYHQMLRPGMMHSINFTIQRELPGDMLLELGYVGRLGRNLPQSVNLNSIPFFMKDPVSGQTFAEAYDALAAELRAGVAAGAVTPQPWFENQMPSMAMLRQLGLCPAAASTATSCLASRFTSEIVTGLLSNFWLNGIDRFRRWGYLQLSRVHAHLVGSAPLMVYSLISTTRFRSRSIKWVRFRIRRACSPRVSSLISITVPRSSTTRISPI